MRQRGRLCGFGGRNDGWGGAEYAWSDSHRLADAAVVTGGLRHTPAGPTLAAPSHQPWTYTTGGGVESSPAVVEGTVYIGSHVEKEYALDAATGQDGAP
ncbi:PQQ-binding-like beta-propeller repeat protein [Streptomyces actinomycinicus]|uniref:PQQ-binding-like beta-propeller repeat protein n=1 Tax=Streptomyces actinomycinicus TaxID=1695166 RepID=UPI0035F48007